MAPFSTRKPAPAWPPFKDSYRRLGDGEDIELMLKQDVDTAISQHSGMYPSPTPRDSAFKPVNPKWYDGWRGGAKVAFSGAISVLILNIVILIAMATGFPHMDGMAMIYIGSCTTSERINTGVHLVVNLLSTGLLAGSSYCMQILSAPSRNDVDKAHAKGTWLDIGIASLRNLRILRKQKVILWWLLALSTIPLHLFYNSVFFAAIATNDYNILYATEPFVNGAAYDTQRFPDTKDMNVTHLQSKAKNWKRLTNEECITAYAMDFVTERKDVVAIIRSNSSMSSSSLQSTAANVIPNGGLNAQFDAYAWICNDTSTLSRTHSSNGTFCSKMVDALEPLANTEWRSGGFDILYCLSETIEADCHVHFAPQIMAPVIFFNIVKALVIAYVAFFYKDKPIVTLGDAIETFSLQPDPTTQGMCLATHEMVEKHWTRGYTPHPMRYDGRGRRWFHSASWKQWLALGSVFTVAAVGVLACIAAAIVHSEPNTIANAWSLGIGKVRTQNLIDGLSLTSLGPNGIFVSAIIANLPQTMFSFIYLIYNNVFTTMVLNDEWDRFSIKSGKGRVLRVSDPRGEQRSTYFLQIPYRYAIVMLITSGLLHWLVSQSVFLANIAVVPLDGIKPKNDEVTTCAYSVKAMFFILVLGVFMLTWLFGNGFRRFSGGMPFVGTNSAAIAAACHPEYGLRCEREAMVLKPLRWGVTDYGVKKSPKPLSGYLDTTPLPTGDGDTDTFDKRQSTYYEESLSEEMSFGVPVGHCTFTDGRVARPVDGRLYA